MQVRSTSEKVIGAVSPCYSVGDGFVGAVNGAGIRVAGLAGEVYG